jgi:hypothetical protein
MSIPRNPPLDRDSRVSRGHGFLEAVADGEVIALDRDRAVCYGLNRTGSRVWTLIGDGARIGDICAQLVKEYRVDGAVCERQVLDLLEELRIEGLVRAQ